TVVDRMKRSGAIVLGKLNMDEFGMGSSTEYSAYGATHNPWNLDCVPGGSSGGSGAAVSSCECSVALGSDTGGSIRCPASFCSVLGLKPTYGIVSRFGLVSYANSLEQIGPVARSVEDLVLIMNVIAGKDEKDDTSLQSPHHVSLQINQDSKVKSIAIVRELMEGSDPEVSKTIYKVAEKFQEVGVEISEVSLKSVS